MVIFILTECKNLFGIYTHPKGMVNKSPSRITQLILQVY